MKKTKFLIYSIIGIAILAVLTLKVFNNSDKDKSKDKADNKFEKLVSRLEGMVVRPATLVNEIDVSGTICPFDETVLISEVAGRVVNLNLQEGKAVKRGTLLVKIFDADLQAQLKMLEVQLKIAENNEARMKTLLNINGTSQQEYDASTLQVSNLNAQIDILKVNIGKTEIRAPYDGVIGLKKISVGQYITNATQIVTIRAVNSMKLDFSVPERYGLTMTPGTKILFKVAGIETSYEARVIATESSIEPDSRNLKIRALVSGNTKGLIPGAFAKVRATLGSRDDAIMIPTSAIVPQANIKRVFVAKNGRASQVAITTGIRQAGDIEVLTGLNPGDTVVVTGILFIKPNSPVKFSKVK
jgi:membrane fusion protein, multidrug efflux system